MATSPRRVCVLIIVLLLAGCASVPIDRSRSAVADQLAERSGNTVTLAIAGAGELDADLQARLSTPLSVDSAVEIAWRLSPRSKAALAKLQLAAADLFDSQRPRNPGLSLGRLGSGASAETSVGLHVLLTDLLTLPARRRAGAAQWQADIAATVDALLDQAAEVRMRYYHYQAAEQVAAMRAAVAEAAQLSAEMARRFHAAGNISALQLAREEANESMARNDAAQARVERLDARMALAEVLGLAGRSNGWRVPAQLPLPGAVALPVEELLALARSRRADLAAAHAALDAGTIDAATARRIGWLGEIELGVEREREDGKSRRGASIDLALPVFSRGQGTVARADARQELALQRAERIEQGIQRDVRSGIARLQTQAEIVETYRSVLIPRRQAIVAREQERYNFMLIGVFELLESRRQEFDSYQQYLEAIRDYWLAWAALERAVGGALPAPATVEFAPRVEDIVAPPAAEGGHDHH